MQRRLLLFAVLGGALFLFAPGHERIRVDDVGTAEDEVLIREAERLGLAEHDPIVRRRLIEKALFYAEDTDARVAMPIGDDEARAVFERDPAKFAAPPSVHFIHVFASTKERAAALLPKLAADASAVKIDDVGDAFPLPREVDSTIARISSLYGADFADALARAQPGAWSGPIESRYGFHDVLVVARNDGARRFAEAKADVIRAIDRDRRARARKDFVDAALARVRVEVGGVRVTSLPAPAEPAQSSPSFED